MQVPQEESNSSNRVGIEEHLIKFRPSPNFKNMKKFIKSRSVTADEGSLLLAALETSESLPSPSNGRSTRVPADIQPPLPLDPPPPDSPSRPRTPKPKMSRDIEVKKEIEDLEYENINQVAPEQETQDVEGANSEQTNDQKSEICRDFVRGNCKRHGTCKFSHKFDLSQLEGVYTFCRKYQNSICTYTNCKYVHASVFEERHFYRTGVLPPHALAHHKIQVLQPPPPPPPEETAAPSALPPNVDFSNPPPPLPSVIHQPPVMPGTSSGTIGRGLMDDTRNNIQPKPMKHGWRATETFPAATCDHAYVEHVPKKCKNCDDTKIRLQYNLYNVNKMKRSKEELNKKMAVLDKKSNKLLSIILAVLKPTISSRAQNRSNGINGDTDKALLDQHNIGRQQ